VFDEDKTAEQQLFQIYNEHSKIPAWMLEHCRKQRLSGLKWTCSIPSKTPAVIMKHRISFMVRWKLVDLISSVKVPVKVKCAELNRHDATINSVPQQEEMLVCLWDVLEKKRVNLKQELKGPLLAGLRGNDDLKQILPSTLFPEMWNSDKDLYHWLTVKVATVEWKTFSNLMNSQGAKAYNDQEGESSEPEYRGLKYAILKGAIATSMGVRERIEAITSGNDNLAKATRQEAANLVDASLGRCAQLLGGKSKKTLSDLKNGRKTPRRASAKDALEEYDLTLDGSEEEDVHGRPNPKKARMQLDRNDAEEDANIPGYDSEGADEAMQVLCGSDEKTVTKRGRKITYGQQKKGLSAEFASIFSAIKKQVERPPPLLPPHPHRRLLTISIRKC
jgi:hypothetical protein